MHNRFEFAYMEKQIADTVMKIAKDNACILEEQSEVPASLTERDIKSYLNEVIAEVVKLAKTKSTGPGSERRSAIRRPSPPWRTPLLFPRSFLYGERSFRFAQTTRSCLHENSRGTTLKSKFRCPDRMEQRRTEAKLGEKTDSRQNVAKASWLVQSSVPRRRDG